MTHFSSTAVLAAVFLAGCGSLGAQRYLLSGSALFAEEEKPSEVGESEAFWAAFSEEEEPFWAGLAVAAREANLIQPAPPGVPGGGFSAFSADGVAGGSTEVLAKSFRTSSVMNKLIAVNVASMAKRPIPDVSWGRREFEDFLPAAMGIVGIRNQSAPDDVTASAFSDENDTKTGTFKIIQAYLVAYFKGEFVDRSGVKLARPEIKSEVGNDTITAFLTVIMEGVFDSLYRIPVYKQKGKWLTATGKQPTAAVLKLVDVREVEEDERITEWEVRAIQYLSDVAGEQSKVASGLFVRLLGDAQFAVGIGAHISIGDNETLAKTADTFFEVSSRRTTEALAYRYFRNSVGEDTKLKKILDIIRRVYEALEEKE